MVYGWNRYSRLWEPRRRLSVLDLVNNGTLSLKLACLLWLMMEHRASVVVAALPNFAGKTTLLDILLDFLPPQIKQVHLYGSYANLEFLDAMTPSETCLVAEEFNTYLDYVWGDVAIKAFELLDRGYSLGGTIHARTPKEVVYLFYKYLGLELPVIARLGAIINLQVLPGETWASEPVRRINSVGIPLITEDTMTIEIIAAGEPETGEIQFAGNEKLQALFSTKFNAGKIDIAHEITIRRQALENLQNENKVSSEEVRQMVVDFYDSRDRD